MANYITVKNAFNIGNSKNKRGWGTVYPFSFTTTTLSPQEQTKAYVVRAAQDTTAVMKRDGTPTTSTYFTTTTVAVVDDGLPKLRRRDYEADESNQYGDGGEKIGSAVPQFRVRQALEPAQTSTVRPSDTIGSNQTSSTTVAAGLLSSSASFHLNNSSLHMSLSNSTAPNVIPSTLHTIQVSSSNGNNSRTNIGSSSFSMVSPSATPSSTRASGSSLTETQVSATTLLSQGSTVSTNRSASGSYIVASGAKNTFGTTSSASGLANTTSPATSTITGSSSPSFSGTSSSISAASIIQSSGAIVAGSPAATSSASAVSSSVASASSAAAALAADLSNKQKAQTAQKQTHDAETGKSENRNDIISSLKLTFVAAAALLALTIRGSPLANALSSLVESLSTAAAKVDAAVDASTPAGVSAAVADLVWIIFDERLSPYTNFVSRSRILEMPLRMLRRSKKSPKMTMTSHRRHHQQPTHHRVGLLKQVKRRAAPRPTLHQLHRARHSQYHLPDPCRPRSRLNPTHLSAHRLRLPHNHLSARSRSM